MEMKLRGIEKVFETQKHNTISRYDYYIIRVFQKYFALQIIFVLTTILLVSADVDNQELSLWHLNTHNNCK